jgi:hypothetical protein
VLSSVQQLTSGVAAIVGGLIIGTAAAGGEGMELPAAAVAATQPITGYPWVGIVSAVFTLLSVILGGYLRPAGKPATTLPSESPVAPETIAEQIAASA